MAAARHQRGRRLGRQTGRRCVVVVRARQRRREDRRRKPHRNILTGGVGVRTGPGRRPGRSGARRRGSVIPAAIGVGPRRTAALRRRDRGRRRRRPRTGTRARTRTRTRRRRRRRRTRTRPRPRPRSTHPVRRVLQPLRRRQQERRLIQIDTLRRPRRLRDLRLRPVLLLVPPDHLTHRQPRPQRRLTAVPRDHQPLEPAVRPRTLRPVLRPHHEPQLELPHPHLTVLIRGHVAVDPLVRAFLRLSECHHRAHPPPGRRGRSRRPPSGSPPCPAPADCPPTS